MELKPLTPLTARLTAALGVNLGLTLVGAYVGALYVFWYSRQPAASDGDYTGFAVDLALVVSGFARLLILLVMVITFFRWIYRATKNLRAFGDRPMRFTPGWAVGGFFIPIANIVLGYQSMYDIWRASLRGVNGTSRIVLAWWIVLFAANATSRFGFEYETALATSLLADFFLALATIVTLVLIRQIGTAYDANYGADQVPSFNSRASLSSDGPARSAFEG